VSLAAAPNVLFAYLGFGFFGGTAAGFVYVTCVNMVGKWYPERKGGKTGFVNGGFAYGSVPFIFLFTSYLDVSNYQGLLLLVGLLLAGLVAVSGFFFKDPPKNWWPAHVDPLKGSDDPRIQRALLKNPPAVKQYTPTEAIKTGILPLMWFVLLCTAGINIFGIAMQVPFGKEMGFAGGIVALAMSLKAIVNGTGRGVIGWISDLYGGGGTRSSSSARCWGWPSTRSTCPVPSDNMPLFLLASMISGFGGGAIFPLFAAMTADYFGENNNATNYGLVYSSKVGHRPGWCRCGLGRGEQLGLRRRVHDRRYSRCLLRVHLDLPAPAQGARSHQRIPAKEEGGRVAGTGLASASA
jgi:MFS family permease